MTDNVGARSPLGIPVITPDDTALGAALKYAGAGWYVLPVRRGTINPGSVVGTAWAMKSSRDPKQIVAWMAGTDHGVALHCGRSGAVVFDVDDPEAVPDDVGRFPIWLTVRNAPCRQGCWVGECWLKSAAAGRYRRNLFGVALARTWTCPAKPLIAAVL
jgi:Bifunctional DNA primase/polymerase, N-terminal